MHYLDPVFLIQTLGLLGVVAIIFAESGLFFGFFLPGDSLLFTAGFLASQGYMNIFLLIILSAVAAIVGDNVGYAFGKKVGISFFVRDDSFFFHKKHVAHAQHFYEKYGKKTIVIARFIPVVRTFAPIVAGIAQMNYRVFLTYNIVGGLLWTVGLTVLGFTLGSIISNVDAYLLPIIIAIIVASFIPVVIELLKNRRK